LVFLRGRGGIVVAIGVEPEPEGAGLLAAAALSASSRLGGLAAPDASGPRTASRR
jgi:hypothetical protein